MEQRRGDRGASQRLASWLAWAMCALSLTLTALNFVLIAMNVSLNTPAYAFWPELTSLAVGYSVIGAIIASRLPNHPVGWICCAIGLIAAVDHFAGEYCLYALVAQPHPLAGGREMLWLQGWFWMLFIGLIVFLLLLFPTGRLPSRRWRPFAWASVAIISVGVIYSSVISPDVGFYYFWLTEGSWRLWASYLLVVVGGSSGPIAIGIAILRYRLYEIDLIINRTLVYGSLTLMLALVYFGGVASTQAIFRTITGHEEQPQLAIVVSTLVIAALFSPLRRRIQSGIDRRFYRKKYDARKTLETFSAKLRDETDLDALSDELVGVIAATMQPAHVSLWLRSETAPKKSEAPG